MAKSLSVASSLAVGTVSVQQTDKTSSAFELYLDPELSPYHERNDYFLKANDRMDRTFGLIENHLNGGAHLDIGASPFYLLYRSKVHGARDAQGVYFSHDAHPLKDKGTIYSRSGPIGIKHANVETDPLPYADNSFDVVTACEILEHLEHFPTHFGSEVSRVLRPGGVFLATVPNVASIGNIIKLAGQRNIYMKYRSDSTGRHKHEYTITQVRALMEHFGFEILKACFLPSPTAHNTWFRPLYRVMAATPVVQLYSPVLCILCRQPEPKSLAPFGHPSSVLYSDDHSIEG